MPVKSRENSSRVIVMGPADGSFRMNGVLRDLFDDGEVDEPHMGDQRQAERFQVGRFGPARACPKSLVLGDLA